ncbi:hypothetical protein BC832DRAFT_281231 [Gaertneriomyces semiglobifer]|nr:hypothetical protein BC832DRAFT_281231 [Gaertneriomyces semiglobifer]
MLTIKRIGVIRTRRQSIRLHQNTSALILLSGFNLPRTCEQCRAYEDGRRSTALIIADTPFLERPIAVNQAHDSSNAVSLDASRGLPESGQLILSVKDDSGDKELLDRLRNADRSEVERLYVEFKTSGGIPTKDVFHLTLKRLASGHTTLDDVNYNLVKSIYGDLLAVDIVPDSETFEIMTRSAILARDLPTAYEFYQKLVELDGVNQSLLVELIAEATTVKDTHKLNEFMDYANARGFALDGPTLGYVVSYYIKHGELERALRGVEDIVQRSEGLAASTFNGLIRRADIFRSSAHKRRLAIALKTAWRTGLFDLDAYRKRKLLLIFASGGAAMDASAFLRDPDIGEWLDARTCRAYVHKLLTLSAYQLLEADLQYVARHGSSLAGGSLGYIWLVVADFYRTVGLLDKVNPALRHLVRHSTIPQKAYAGFRDSFVNAGRVEDIIDLWRITNGHVWSVRRRVVTNTQTKPTFLAIATALKAATEEYVVEGKPLPHSLYKASLKADAAARVASDVDYAVRMEIKEIAAYARAYKRHASIESIRKLLPSGTPTSADAEKLHEALDIMAETSSVPLEVYNMVIECDGQLGQWERVAALHDEIKHKSNYKASRWTICALLELGRTAEARQILRSGGWDTSQDSIGLVIRKLLEKGHITEANRWFDTIHQRGHSAIWGAEMYNIGLLVKLSGGHYEDAVCIFKKMSAWHANCFRTTQARRMSLDLDTNQAFIDQVVLLSGDEGVKDLVQTIWKNRIGYVEQFFFQTARILTAAKRHAAAATVIHSMVAVGFRPSTGLLSDIFYKLVNSRDPLNCWRLYRGTVVEHGALSEDQAGSLLPSLLRLCNHHPTPVARAVKREIKMYQSGEGVPPRSRLRFEVELATGHSRQHNMPRPVCTKAIWPTFVPLKDAPTAPESAMDDARRKEDFATLISIAYKRIQEGQSVAPVYLRECVRHILWGPTIVNVEDLLATLLKPLLGTSNGEIFVLGNCRGLVEQHRKVVLLKLVHVLHHIGHSDLATTIVKRLVQKITHTRDTRAARELPELVHKIASEVDNLPEVVAHVTVNLFEAENIPSVIDWIKQWKLGFSDSDVWDFIQSASINVDVEALQSNLLRILALSADPNSSSMQQVALRAKLLVCRLNSDSTAAEQIWREAATKAPIVDVLAHRYYLEVLADVGDKSTADQVWRTALSEGVELDLPSKLGFLTILLKGGDITTATTVLEEVRAMDGQVPAKVLNLYIDKLGTRRQLDGMLDKCVEEVRRWKDAAHADAVAPFELSTLMLLMKYAAMTEDQKQTRAVYNAMTACGYTDEQLKPLLGDLLNEAIAEGHGLFLYITLQGHKKAWGPQARAAVIDYYSRHGKLTKMGLAFAEAKQLGMVRMMSAAWLESLIQRHCQIGGPSDVQTARWLYNELTVTAKRLPTSKTLETLISACANPRWPDPKAAEFYLNSMKDIGLVVHFEQRMFLLQAWACSGVPDQAERCLSLIRNTGMMPTTRTWFWVCWAYLVKGDLPEAERVLMRVRTEGYTVRTILGSENVLRKLASAGSQFDLEGALDLWRRCVRGRAQDSRSSSLSWVESKRVGRAPPLTKWRASARNHLRKMVQSASSPHVSAREAPTERSDAATSKRSDFAKSHGGIRVARVSTLRRRRRRPRSFLLHRHIERKG